MVQILQVIEAMLEFYIFGGKLDSAIDALALYKKFKELQKALKVYANLFSCVLISFQFDKIWT